MISDVIAVVDFFDRHLERASILKAMFTWDCKKIHGSSKIEVNKIPVAGRENQWFYSVKEIKDYVFIPYPVIPTAYYDFGTLAGNKNPDAQIFRFVSHSMSTFQSGGAENLLVDFIVFGYKPEDLIEKKELRP